MKINKKVYVIIGVILVAAVIGFGYLKITGNEESDIEGLNQGQMRAICELATLETYYHNTAQYNHENTTLFIFNHTQTLWIEYDGVVEIGTDVSQLSMKEKGSKVIITIPHSKITDCKVDSKSLKPDSYHTNYEGLLTDKINYEDQQLALKTAQDEMRKTAENNTLLFIQADERVETLLSNYVNNIGKVLGKEYQVEFKYIEE